MELRCEKQVIRLRISDSEKRSMLVVGGSRMGKTYFVSNLAAELIENGYIVHLIDLGEKWNDSDKNRLLNAGAEKCSVGTAGHLLTFRSDEELLGCAEKIASAFGNRSMRVNRALKSIFKELVKENDGCFMLDDVVERLEIEQETASVQKEGLTMLYEYFDGCGEVPNILFSVDAGADCYETSMIWELSGLDDSYVQMMTYLLSYQLLCQRKWLFKERRSDKGIFLVIDEFQNLNLDRKSILGTCLTEGQKYGFSLILITQFLAGNFSEPVINQFKQGGYRFFFRLTEEEAAHVSKQIAHDTQTQKVIYKKLTTFPRGHCLMMGSHFVGACQESSEVIRFVEACATTELGGYFNKIADKGVDCVKRRK